MVFVSQKWVILVFVQLLIEHAYTQYAVPMYPMPPPIHVAVAVPIPVTSTTTERTVAIAVPVPVPMPMPMPVQVAVPAPPPPPFCQALPRAPACPPCPPCVCTPSCTPSFFSYCSACHQQCRCRNGTDAPIPPPIYPPMPVPGPAFPMPVPVPQPPVLMVPYPPIRPPLIRRRPKKESSCDDDSDTDDTDDTDDSDYYSSGYKRRQVRIYGRRGRRGGRGNRRRVKRRNIPNDFSDGELIKPVLTYISNNGDIKIKQRLSNTDAEHLLDENKLDNGRRSAKHKVLTGNNPRQTSLKVLAGTSSEDDDTRDTRKRQVPIRRGVASRVLRKGKKEIVFKPPGDKKITNLSVSFNVE